MHAAIASSSHFRMHKQLPSPSCMLHQNSTIRSFACCMCMPESFIQPCMQASLHLYAKYVGCALTAHLTILPCLNVSVSCFAQAFQLCCCREQERREERQRIRSEAGGTLDPLDDEGSFDDGDPYTTNLYIGMCRLCRELMLSHVNKFSLLQMPCYTKTIVLYETHLSMTDCHCSLACM